MTCYQQDIGRAMREGVTEGNHNRRKSMKTKGLVFVSCLVAGALITSPAIGKPAKKSSVSKSKRTAPQTTQVTRNYRNVQNTSARTSGTNYYGGTQNYYGGGYPYGSSSVWPYVAASVAPYVASSLSNSYSYYGGYPYNNSYHGSGYGYSGTTVASVQRRLGEFGYYHGV